MIEPNTAPIVSAPRLNPGDRLLGNDAEGNEAVFVVLSVHPKLDANGLSSVTYVLRQRESWTITVGEAALAGNPPRYRQIDDASPV